MTRSASLVFAAAALVACADDTPRTSSERKPVDAPKDAITKVTERGPVKATVSVWPAKPTLLDEITLRLEVESPTGVNLDVPLQEVGERALGRFEISDYVPPATRVAADGKTILTHTYFLDAPSSGKHRIPPLRFEMTDARSGATTEQAKPQEVMTDEIPLEIAPVPAELAAKELSPALGALDEDVGGTSPIVIVGILGAAMVLGSGSILAIRGLRNRRRVEAQRSAYDEAVSHLRALERRGAPDATSADAWFVELSAIVRRYLEHRYEIRAPELTTEEFLLVATARPELTTEHRGLLTSFLERCDRVKFAGYRPDAEESIATLAAARGFVEDSRLREATV